MIYLDNAATTRVYREAAQVMTKYATEEFFNPSALYNEALMVSNQLSAASESIAVIAGAKKNEIIFTSGATESNNFALECGYKNKKGSIVISGGEHASVYEMAMKHKSSGRDVKIVPLTTSGCVDTDKLYSQIDANTAIVSVIHCSNETGAVNDISEISNQIKKINSKTVFHSDGVQAFTKINFDFDASAVDLYSISAHKIGGFKGVGALLVRNGFNMQPYIVGGGQQGNRRSGTENVGGIISFATATQMYSKLVQNADVRSLRQYCIDTICNNVCDVIINNTEHNSGYILSASFVGIKGEILSHMLEDKGIIVGLGSACSTHTKSSRVLKQMGLTEKEADGSIRISFSPETKKEEVAFAMNELISAANKLKGIING